MSPKLKEVEKQAVLLSPQDRESLAAVLIQSLDGETPTEVDEAWIQEAERRYQDYVDGKTQGIPGDTVFSEIRRELGWQR